MRKKNFELKKIVKFLKFLCLFFSMRCLGGAVLNICYVALGAAECAYDFGAHAWDYAASEFIVREAGGVTIDPSGGDFDIMSRRLLVANSMEMAKQLSNELVQYYPSPRDDE